jgi:hypothetical protein
MNSQNILLLTATISPPPGVPRLQKTNPIQRLQDYISALSYYAPFIPSTLDSIVFVENSNSDLESLKSIVAQKKIAERVEFIGFDGLDYPPSFGRGYGEFKLIDFAMKHSTIIQLATSHDRIWKVTGRYVVVNFAEILETAPSDFHIYCDVKNWPMHWMDLRMLAWSKEGYQKVFEGKYNLLNQHDHGLSPEIVMRRVLDDSFHVCPDVYPRFRTLPFISGTRGMNDARYDKGINYFKYLVRANVRKIAPLFWV